MPFWQTRRATCPRRSSRGCYVLGRLEETAESPGKSIDRSLLPHPLPRNVGKESFLRRLILLAPALALTRCPAACPLGPALSKVLVGTDDPETLIGTKRNDQITGKGGLDILKGRAGNDTYFFADDWGQDFLIEGRGQGMDTLDFSDVDERRRRGPNRP